MAQTQLAPTPRITKAVITGKELLMAIREAVLTEPKRADLSWWVKALDGDSVVVIPEMPACGTVACLAGWGAVLLRPDHASVRRLSSSSFDVMRGLLGVGRTTKARDVGSLFDNGPVADFGETDESFGEPRTLQHANTIAARIEKYLAAHPEVATRKINVKAARQALAK